MDAPAGFKQATRDNLVDGLRFLLVPLNGGTKRKGEISSISMGRIATIEAGSALFFYDIDVFLNQEGYSIFIEETYPTDARRVEYIYVKFSDGGEEYSLDMQNIEDVLTRVGSLAYSYCTYFRYEAEVKEARRTVLMRSEALNVSRDTRIR